MNHTLQASKLTLKKTSDELQKPGDYCIVENLGSVNDSVKPHQAIILNCPYCRMALASTNKHVVEMKKTFFGKLFGSDPVPTVTPMLQCPYVSAHKFNIRKGRVLPQ